MKPTKALLIFESILQDLPKDSDSDTALPDSFRAELLHAMFLDTLALAPSAPDTKIIGFRHPDGVKSGVESEPSRRDVRDQVQGCVGRRIQDSIDQAMDEGARHILVLFSHAPTYAARFVSRAFALLDAFEDALILGSTSGGALAAIGMRHTHPVISEYLAAACVLRTDDVLQVLPSSEMLVLPLPSWRSPISYNDVQLLFELESETTGSSASTHVISVVRSHPELFVSREPVS